MRGCASFPLVLMAILGTLNSISISGVYAATCNPPPGNLKNCLQLSPYYALSWEVRNDEVVFGVQADTDSAWIGLGLSSSGGMKGAEMFIISGDSSSLQVQKYWSTVYGRPSLSSDQDATLVKEQSSRGSGSTTAVFRRALEPCTAQSFALKENYDHSVIWAMGNSNTLNYHGPDNRGTAKIVFRQVDEPFKAPETDLTQYNVTFNNYKVPSNSTTYTCVTGVLDLPDPTKKYHIVRSTGTAKSKLVHHMILYACANRPSRSAGTYFDCTNMDAECATFVLGWAPGSQTDEMPEEAGFAIGTGVGAFKYYTLQIHYDNPTGIANQTDSSGFEFWYTPTLRPNDLAVLTTGIVNFTIPASTSTYTLDGGGCPSACTKNFSQPITLWRNAFHMHSLGKNMTTRHIRNNTELEPLGSRPFWDFNHQSLSRIDGNKNGTRVFLPGDQLITKCSYDSSGKNVSTTYGESTSNEMCFNFLLYWPRMREFEYCLTDEVGGVCGNNTAVERVSADLGNFQPYTAQCDSEPTLSPATAQDSGASSTFMSPAKYALVLWVAVLILLM